MMRNTLNSNTFVSVMGTNQTNIVSFPKKNSGKRTPKKTSKYLLISKWTWLDKNTNYVFIVRDPVLLWNTKHLVANYTKAAKPSQIQVHTLKMYTLHHRYSVFNWFVYLKGNHSVKYMYGQMYIHVKSTNIYFAHK